MSANRWTHCPKCSNIRRQKFVMAMAVADNAYGHVLHEEYLRLRRVAAALDGLPEEETMREDYEILIYDGVFYVDFGASCDTCGYSFCFKHREKTDAEPTNEEVMECHSS